MTALKTQGEFEFKPASTYTEINIIIYYTFMLGKYIILIFTMQSGIGATNSWSRCPSSHNELVILAQMVSGLWLCQNKILKIQSELTNIVIVFIDC